MTDQQQGGLRRRLGRGLNALLGGGETAEASDAADGERSAPATDQTPGDPSEIHVELIERNPFQPRTEFDEASIDELVASIRQHGVLQPLLVRAAGDGYQLIAGERRLIAARKAALDVVPCRVLSLDDQATSEAALEENLKRRDLNVLEKAHAFRDYLERFGCKVEELSKRLSMQRSTVSNFLRLLELSDPVKHALAADKITAGHARALLPLPAELQAELCERVQVESLTVRKTEQAVRELLKRDEPAGGDVEPTEEAPATLPFPSEDQATNPHLTAHVVQLQERLRDSIGLPVEIKPTGPASGRVTIQFRTHEDFQRLLEYFTRAA